MKCRHQLLILAGLTAVCIGVQAVVVRRAVVPGLDAVRFVRIARSIGNRGLMDTVRWESEQPLYPAWLWVVHSARQRVLGVADPLWVTSAQWAAAVPLVLAVTPLFRLLRRLVGPAAAVAGTLLFCVLPEVSRLGADGISDSTHLLFFCVAFWAIVEYFHRRDEGNARPGVLEPIRKPLTPGPSPRKRGEGRTFSDWCSARKRGEGRTLSDRLETGP
jgi:hypothetical protein